MAIPIAAIAAAAQQGIALASRAQLQRQTGAATAALARRVAGAALGGAGIAVEAMTRGVPAVAQIATQPGAPTITQRLAAGPTGETVRLMRQAMGGSAGGFGFVGRRRRRMNACNVKALRRAGRRVESFVKLAKSLVTMPPGARAKFPIKSRRKKRC